MAILSATVSRIFVLFLFIFAGYLLVRIKVLPKSSSEVLSKLENNLFIPCLVLGTFSSNFTVEKIGTAWKLFLISFVLCLLMMLISLIIVHFTSKDQFIRNIYRYGLVFSNFGFMGNAVVSAVFPDIFFEYLIFTLPFWTMIYVWGVPCLLIPRKEGDVTFLSRLGSFVNPMFVAMFVGMIIGLANITLPDFISDAVGVSGDCMSPVSMLLTGVVVATMDLKKVLKTKSIYAVTFIRLLALPLIALLLCKIIGVPEVYLICIVCVLSMPLGLNIMVIPAGYGKDTSVAAGAIVVSHLISAITIPFVFWLMTI